jgi:pilus assembly protein CpaB
MNPKALIPLVAGLGIGGLALMLGINLLKSARAGQSPSAQVKLWAAKEDIPRGTELKESLLVEVAYPADLVPQGAFQQKEELVGRVPRLVAPGGLPILETMLSPQGTKPGIFVKPGYRAVAVKIDAGSGVDYHLEPGCFVDVVGSFKINRGGKSEIIARTIIESVEVAAVGPHVSPTTSTDEDRKQHEKDRGVVRAVTLFVKPEDVPKLLLTEQQGRIKLSMRGNPATEVDESAPEVWAREGELTGDAVEPSAGPPTAAPTPLDWLRGLFAQPAGKAGPALAAAPTPPALPRWILKIYRGDKEEIVRFKNAESSERVDGSDDAAAASSAAQPVATIPMDSGDHPEPQEDPE